MAQQDVSLKNFQKLNPKKQNLANRCHKVTTIFNIEQSIENID